MSEEGNWITFDKDRYHLNNEMYEWCIEKVGPGGWAYGTPKTWEGMGDQCWVMQSMFGRTTFAFKNPHHLTLFALRWSS